MQVGELFAGRFDVEFLAGSGGMGQVYRARDRQTGEPVALKVLQGNGAQDLSRFAREAQALAAVRLPGVVRYIAHGATAAGQPYLAMEWLEGETLSQRLARAALSVADAVALGARVSATLGAVHRLGLVHRDLKPGNLLLVDGDVERVMLIDFGLARISGVESQLTQAGTVLGTPGYMAPEQARGQLQIDARADVFSLGCVLFKCLTGRAPFQGSGLALLAKVLIEQPPGARELRKDVPARLDTLIARMLSKPPEQRPRDGTAVAAELAALDRGSAASIEGAAEGDAATATTGESARAPEITSGERRIMCLVLASVTVDKEEPIRNETEVNEQEDALAALADRYRGRVELVDGRSPLVVLSGAGAATDLAAQAAHCALALHNLLGAHVALATGRAEVTERLPVAELIDQAFQLLPIDPTTAGDPGVHIDEMTAGLLGTRFEVGRTPTGITLQRGQASLDTLPELLGKPTPCVGRDRELALLAGEWDRCVDDRSASAMLVTGTAGLGKSRLRQEFLRLLRDRGEPVEIWIGQADPMGAGSAFGLLAHALQRALGLLDGEPVETRRRKLLERIARHRELDAEARRTAAFLGEILGVPFPDDGDVQLRAARQNPMLMGDQIRNAWENFIRAECSARPVLLVLEDLHWGDLPTVTLIDSALRYLKDRPLMVLALGRPEVGELFPRLWADRTGQQINLTPLPRRASERLVRTVLGDAASPELVAKLVGRADGNAFFLEEQIRAAAEGRGEGLPETVLAMVQARLEALDPEARRVLRAASVFGDTFWEGGVTALVGGMQATPWLLELEHREVVTRRGEGRLAGEVEYRFRHGLVREAAYGMLPERDRRLGHALAGDWLEQAGESDGMTLAEHFEIGGASGRAAGMYLRAAEQALRGNDLAAAVDRAERGVACGPEPATLGALRRVQAEAHIWRGELALAEQRGTEAIERLEPGSTGWFSAITQIVHACGKLGNTEAMAQRMELATQARALSGADDARSICLCSGAMELFLCGRYTVADALLDTAAPHVDGASAQNFEVVAKHHEVRAYRAMSGGNPGEGASGLEDALSAYEQAGDRRNACSTRANLGFVYGELGDFERAESALRMALDAAERMGLEDVETASRSNLGLVLAQRGRLAEAQALEEAAIATSQKMSNAYMEALSRNYLAMIAFLAGDLVTSEREAQAAAELAQQMPPVRARAIALLARALLAQGRTSEALDTATEAQTILMNLGAIEEGESLIRLVYAEALAARTKLPAAAVAIGSARDALMARANMLTDPAWREIFLRDVPDNARTLELAHAWLGEHAP